jgi:hypothetical protein
MKRFLLGTGVLTLGLLLTGLTQAEPASESDDLQTVARKGRVSKAKKKGKDRVHEGSSFLSHAKAKRLGDGLHKIHTTRSGHKAHVKLKGGKIRHMHVVDKKGRKVKVHVTKHRGKTPPRKATTRRVGLDGVVDTSRADTTSDLDGVDGELTQVQLLPWFVTFSFFDPFLGRWVFFVWPIDMIDVILLEELGLADAIGV